MRVTYGLNIPRVAVCAGHSAPFDAFAEAYFGRTPVAVWKASRGFGGKSTVLAALVTAEAMTMGAECVVLGGSMHQSDRVQTVHQEILEYKNSPTDMVDGDILKTRTKFLNKGEVHAIPASPNAVRGLHPQRLRLDEIDEMEMFILESAQGQPMRKRGIETQTVMSSTHHHADQTMTAILERAQEVGWPIHEWCWRESVGTEDEPGWLDIEEVERKRSEIARHMWLTEYELQEPGFEGRAIDPDHVDAVFREPLIEDTPGSVMTFEQPVEGADYVVGIDWAQKQDWTIASCFRTDVEPWPLVCWYRVQRREWKEMVGTAAGIANRYGASIVHDMTGVGSVPHEMLQDVYDGPKRNVKGFVMTGRARETLLNDWIVAVEKHLALIPRIKFAYDQHRTVTIDDLFRAGTKFHAPDSFVSFSMAYSGRRSKRVAYGPVGSVKGEIEQTNVWGDVVYDNPFTDTPKPYATNPSIGPDGQPQGGDGLTGTVPGVAWLNN